MQPTAQQQRPLIAHLEKYLGSITGGWKQDADERAQPFAVARFDSPPFKDTTAYATVGLSNYALRGQRRTIQLELMMIVRNRQTVPPAAELLQTVGSELIADKRALLRGDVIDPRGPLWPGSRLEGLYATMPVYFPDGFAECYLSETAGIVIVWLVPITRHEAQFVHNNGWSEFEELLVSQDPDLLDLDRQELMGIERTGR